MHNLVLGAVIGGAETLYLLISAGIHQITNLGMFVLFAKSQPIA